MQAANVQVARATVNKLLRHLPVILNAVLIVCAS